MKKPRESAYTQVWHGEWQPAESSFDLACCDCSLVHGVFIRIRNGRPQIKFTVDARATAQLRRHHKRKKRGTAQAH